MKGFRVTFELVWVGNYRWNFVEKLIKSLTLFSVRMISRFFGSYNWSWICQSFLIFQQLTDVFFGFLSWICQSCLLLQQLAEILVSETFEPQILSNWKGRNQSSRGKRWPHQNRASQELPEDFETETPSDRWGDGDVCSSGKCSQRWG